MFCVVKSDFFLPFTESSNHPNILFCFSSFCFVFLRCYYMPIARINLVSSVQLGSTSHNGAGWTSSAVSRNGWPAPLANLSVVPTDIVVRIEATVHQMQVEPVGSPDKIITPAGRVIFAVLDELQVQVYSSCCIPGSYPLLPSCCTSTIGQVPSDKSHHVSFRSR